MLARISIIFALLAGCAVPHNNVMTDHGTALQRDPYDFQRTRLQTREGAMQGFYALTVDPAKFPSELKPSTAGTGTGDLWIANPTTAWVALEIEGTPVGTIGPLVDAVIKGAPNGTYAVKMTAPNGYVVQSTAETGKVPANPHKSANLASQ